MMDGSLRNVNDICTSRVKHATADANACDHWHRDDNVDIELARELSHSGMHLLGRGNARSNLVGAIDINGGSQGASADGGMPTIEQIGDAQF